ncbi:hypothetical protein F0562_022968 [Nyssa sinensis]|uniref:OVATE domain-containing protein n=1 Tax=Nyssa sinensis TaxID=561372 RepID=A0A5J5BGL9_9ASTE|nr:hypothetical protein F0562_022968 [Nyssa sinensis]
MPKLLQKSLQDYLSKIRKPHTPSKLLSSSGTSWVRQGCLHPKTLSFAIDRKQNEKISKDDDDAATPSGIDRFPFGNFESLYLYNDYEFIDMKNEEDDHEEKSGGFLFVSPKFINPPPHLCGSHRFFVAPSSSSSLMEEARMSLIMSKDTGSSSSSTTTTPLNDSTRNSSDNDQEMIEATLPQYGKVDWEFVEELLLCYLNLNDKNSYKYILSAFVDLIVVLCEKSGKSPA